MGKDLGIDLGTASVLVYVRGKGIVLREPCVVTIDRTTNRVIKVGREAQLMLEKSSGNELAVRPLRDGVISQYEITQQMLQHIIREACGTVIFKPRVVICVPSGITEVEERAVVDAATQAGAKKTYLIEEPVAAAIGAGLDISGPNGHMVVDIGGGTTDIAVLSLGGVVVSESIKCAGDKFDEAIVRYVRRRHNVIIGERTAEKIKIRIGSVWPDDNVRTCTVKGKCLVQGLPRQVQINSQEIPDAVEEPVSKIVEAICSVLERTPPELIDDILRNGIVMTGGGSLLNGLDRIIAYTTRIKTRVADKAIQCVALGTGKSLDLISAIPEGVLNISRNRYDSGFNR